jgi:hypothetical protein
LSGTSSESVRVATKSPLGPDDPQTVIGGDLFADTFPSIAYAPNALAHPDAKTVVVLVTDGEPNNCTDSSIPAADRNNIANIGAEVEKYKDIVPTYVIGVGTSVTNLNTIAQKGGTNAAIQIDVGNPSVTEKQLGDTIDAIRLKALSCELAIPPAPNGETLLRQDQRLVHAERRREAGPRVRRRVQRQRLALRRREQAEEDRPLHITLRHREGRSQRRCRSRVRVRTA